MKAIVKKVSKYFVNYELPEKTLVVLKEEIETQGKESSGKIWISEHIVNTHGLTPRHITENFENVNVEMNFVS